MKIGLDWHLCFFCLLTTMFFIVVIENQREQDGEIVVFTCFYNLLVKRNITPDVLLLGSHFEIDIFVKLRFVI
jgi:hypothetical protein